MHIHIHVKLGIWERIGVVLLCISAVALTLYIVCRTPSQADVFPCIAQLESIKTTKTEHQETLRKCYMEITKSAVEIRQLSFIVKSVLIWLGLVISVYALFVTVSWIRAGRKK